MSLPESKGCASATPPRASCLIRGVFQEDRGPWLGTDVVDMLMSVSSFLVPLYYAPPQKPFVRLCENCDCLLQGTCIYFQSGVWGTFRILWCLVSPSRGQVRSQTLFSGEKRNLKVVPLRHVLAGCGPYWQISRNPCSCEVTINNSIQTGNIACMYLSTYLIFIMCCCLAHSV